jgi:hypothetical protein
LIEKKIIDEAAEANKSKRKIWAMAKKDYPYPGHAFLISINQAFKHEEPFAELNEKRLFFLALINRRSKIRCSNDHRNKVQLILKRHSVSYLLAV